MADKGNYQPEYSPSGNAAPVRYTLKPGIASQIVMKTLPGAVCTLHQEGESDPTHSLRLYADQEGMLRFYAHPSAGPEVIAKFIVECEVDDKATQYPLELRLSSQPTPQMPAPALPSLKPHRKSASVRPAISEEDAQHLPDEELAKRGYPPRPDPRTAPEAFDVWRRAASTPSTFIEPETVSRPDISYGFFEHEPLIVPTATTQVTSRNWSGFELRGAGPYAWVTGTWRVPHVSAYFGVISQTNSACWVGLDGHNTRDLVQAGTEQDHFDMFGISFGSYFAVTEFLPQQPTAQQITNFPIHPGNEIHVDVFVANADGPPDLAGSFGQFWFENLTTHSHTNISTPRGNTTVGGSGTEWIVERPKFNGHYAVLANYGSVTMYGAAAQIANSSRQVTYQGDDNLQIAMTDGKRTLSTVTPVDDSSMRFSWRGFF